MLPVLGGISAHERGMDVAAGVAGWTLPVLFLDVFILMWFVVREPIKAWQRKQKGLAA